MSVREEESQKKNSCPSKGLGLAAAAIGVGVGAALYYFFNKRPENPDNEGSTSSNWSCEEPQAFSSQPSNRNKVGLEHPITMSANESIIDYSFVNEDDYETISEHSTTDTSIISVDSLSEFTISNDSRESGISDSIVSSSRTESEESISPDSVYAQIISSGSESNDSWDITSDSVDVPMDTMERSPVHRLFNNIIELLSPASDYTRSRLNESAELEYVGNLRQQNFRQRSWSLEECSICCEVMLKDQELEELPCAHSFHAACVRPWLNEQRTCPNCRKLA